MLAKTPPAALLLEEAIRYLKCRQLCKGVLGRYADGTEIDSFDAFQQPRADIVSVCAHGAIYGAAVASGWSEHETDALLDELDDFVDMSTDCVHTCAPAYNDARFRRKREVVGLLREFRVALLDR